MRGRRRGHALVAVLVLACWLGSLDLAVNAQPTPAPTRRPTPQPIDPLLNRGSTSVRDIYPAVWRSSPTATPSPTPLPTPVPPDTSWQGYVFPPPTPSPPFLVWPTGGQLTSGFGVGHLAIDIGTTCGSMVVAARGGLITWAGWRNNGGGYVIDIDHGGGVMTTYNHLSTLLIEAGSHVSQGALIALVGSTGNSTGCHLHFGLYINGWVNPLAYL